MPLRAPVNAHCFADPRERRRAEGWWEDSEADRQFRPDTAGKSAADGIRQTGGLAILGTKYFDSQDLLVRIVRRPSPDQPAATVLLNSPWWLTLDLFSWLMQRMRSSERGPITVLREQLLLPPEWNAATCFVRAYPQAGLTLGAWFGRPRTVMPMRGGPSSRWTAAPEAPESWMYQLYMPGLGTAQGPSGGRNWLVFEGLYDLQPSAGPKTGAFHRCLLAGQQRPQDRLC